MTYIGCFGVVGAKGVRSLGLLAVLVSLSISVTLSSMASSSQETNSGPLLPIIDLHFHPSPGWDPDRLIVLMDDLGVARAGNGVAGVGTRDDVGLGFVEQHPHRFFLFGGGGMIRGFIQDQGEEAWSLKSEEVVQYVAELAAGLEEGKYSGIGELHVNARTARITMRYPADSPLMQRLWALSVAYSVPLSVHMDSDADAVAEMEQLLASDRSGVWIWAHAGLRSAVGGADAPLVRRLLERNANLYCELSARRGFLGEDGRFRPDREPWKELLEDFADRFVIGTDAADQTPAGYAEEVRYWRRVLAQLSPEAAAKMAHRTAEHLLRAPLSPPSV